MLFFSHLHLCYEGFTLLSLFINFLLKTANPMLNCVVKISNFLVKMFFKTTNLLGKTCLQAKSAVDSYSFWKLG